MIRASQRGAELTSRLLAFSRQQPLNPRAVNIGELCMGMTELLHRTLGETIEIDLRREDPSPALADPGQLENALLNLALNARDAMRGAGMLTIEIGDVTLTKADMERHPDGQPGDYVMLKVTDTGLGMVPDVIEHVFEPFFTTKEVGAGSGLGLSMVYGFAQQSGGHVTIESEEGQGTTVALYLPQAKAPAEEAKPESADEAVPKGQGETILVVEDESALRHLAVTQLETLGYRTLQAPDGPVALEVLADSPRIDLLLSDVVLPHGMSGPEIYQQAKEQHPDLRCLFMSGYPVTPEKTLPGGSDLIRKPFSIAELAKRLRSALSA
jgi:CheY-like chemotaxis protein